MNQPFEFEPLSEPERYELQAGAAYQFAADRRDFCKVFGTGLVVVCLLDSAAAQQPGRSRFGGRGRSGPRELGAWLRIAEDGKLTVHTGKTEVGQNIRTSLSQAVADELNLPMDAIQMVMADTQQTPYDGGTAGSRTTPDMAVQLRRVAAAAREALIDLAAEQWQTDRSRLTVANGKVRDQERGRDVEFGQLAAVPRLAQTVIDNPRTTPAAAWRVAGLSAGKVNGADFVTGKHRYASDMRLPGTLYGRVLRPASFGARLESVQTERAQAIPGVIVVKDGDFVAVAAPTTSQAEEALSAIQVQWSAGDGSSDRDLPARLQQDTGGRGGGRGGGDVRVGSVTAGMAIAAVKLDQTYTMAYIAHAPLEPRTALAHWEDGSLTVWTGTQRPFGVRGELAAAFRIAEDRVRVIVPDTGSGYGGKHSGEAAVEAARIAKSAGKPVQLTWTREEEFTWAYFRPAGVVRIASGATREGKLTAWEHHNYNSGASGIRTLYDVPNQLIQYHSSNAPLRQGSYRALASTANIFARESHMDELAHALGVDPLEFRLRNLTDPRLRAVFEAAAKEFGWGPSPPPNRGFGIGGGSEKGSYVATCAEVEVDRRSERIRVVRAVTAFECGAVVNPDHLRNQVEGAMMMGLGGALFEAIEFDQGRVQNASFSGYRVPRFRDTPQIEIILLNRKDIPSAGAGETPIVGIAPAVGNAIFAATGKRVRSLPFAHHGIKS